MDKTQPTISIVVTSYTMERLSDLLELMDSIQEQTYPNFEMLIVTEKSTELRDKLQSYADEQDHINTRILFNDGRPGLSPARNMGIKASIGEIIAFTDDDALPFPNWLEEIAGTFAGNESTIGVTGLAIPLWENEAQDWFPEEFYWIIGCTAFSKLTEVTEVRNVWGANMAFTREAFDIAGVFNEDAFGSSVANEDGAQGLICDDTEFSLRLRQKTGKRILCNPNIQIRHRADGYRLTLRFLGRYAYQHAFSKAALRRNFNNYQGGRMLAKEHALLRQILFKLIPSILVDFLRRPAVAWRQLVATAVILSYTAAGYLTAILRPNRIPEIRQP